ncbi:MAG TPA: flagellar basal body-associated FliL family protein [Alphaproteobacteria bacterium]|nr:flagellar basal body-associated FliL family protein [Alphaproteobacteria bacterium]
MTRREHTLLVALYIAIPLLMGCIGYRILYYKPAPVAVTLHSARGPAAFYTLPTVSVGGLGGTNGQTLELIVSLEVRNADFGRIASFEPHITEQISRFMQQQKLKDIEAPDGETLLREGLRDAIGKGAAPVPILGIAIREMMVE